jgi:hypothetical protein
LEPGGTLETLAGWLALVLQKSRGVQIKSEYGSSPQFGASGIA